MMDICHNQAPTYYRHTLLEPLRNDPLSCVNPTVMEKTLSLGLEYSPLVQWVLRRLDNHVRTEGRLTAHSLKVYQEVPIAYSALAVKEKGKKGKKADRLEAATDIYVKVGAPGMLKFLTEEATEVPASTPTLELMLQTTLGGKNKGGKPRTFQQSGKGMWARWREACKKVANEYVPRIKQELAEGNLDPCEDYGKFLEGFCVYLWGKELAARTGRTKTADKRPNHNAPDAQNGGDVNFDYPHDSVEEKRPDTTVALDHARDDNAIHDLEEPSASSVLVVEGCESSVVVDGMVNKAMPPHWVPQHLLLFVCCGPFSKQRAGDLTLSGDFSLSFSKGGSGKLVNGGMNRGGAENVNSNEMDATDGEGGESGGGTPACSGPFVEQRPDSGGEYACDRAVGESEGRQSQHLGERGSLEDVLLGGKGKSRENTKRKFEELLERSAEEFALLRREVTRLACLGERQQRIDELDKRAKLEEEFGMRQEALATRKELLTLLRQQPTRPIGATTASSAMSV
ncbi:unnamed protein product [Choristocarpus tenellus]